MSSSVMAGEPIGPGKGSFNLGQQPLEGWKSRAYRDPQIGRAHRRVRDPTHVTRGADETDWMGDRPRRGRAHTGIGTGAGERAGSGRSDARQFVPPLSLAARQPADPAGWIRPIA